MFDNKLTKSLKKVNGFIDELSAGIVANETQEAVIGDKIQELELTQSKLSVERHQAQKFINLLNGK